MTDEYSLYNLRILVLQDRIAEEIRKRQAKVALAEHCERWRFGGPPVYTLGDPGYQGEVPLGDLALRIGMCVAVAVSVGFLISYFFVG